MPRDFPWEAKWRGRPTTAGVVELATERNTKQWYDDAASYWKVRWDTCWYRKAIV